MTNIPLTVGRLLDLKREPLALELLTHERGLSRVIPGSDVSSPGLVLTGYTERFPSNRVQVLGETEVAFLHSLKPDRCRAALRTFFSFDLPAVFITKGQKPPAPLLEIANERGTPVILSHLRTFEFYQRLKPFLEEYFAPTTALHGSLADVYGVGLLFMGKSGPTTSCSPRAAGTTSSSARHTSGRATTWRSAVSGSSISRDSLACGRSVFRSESK